MKPKTRSTSLVTAPRHIGGSKHDTATKLEAVRNVRSLMREGLTKWHALEQIAKDHNVSATTMSNWLNKYKDVTVTLQKSNGNIASTLRNNHNDGFAIQSVNVRLTSGKVETLTPIDITKIASLASTIC